MSGIVSNFRETFGFTPLGSIRLTEHDSLQICKLFPRLLDCSILKVDILSLPYIFGLNDLNITKTYLYNFDPLKPHFYRGVDIIFLISAQNIDCEYSLKPPRRGASNEYQQSIFWEEIWKKNQNFYLKTFSFGWWNIQYIWICLFRNAWQPWTHPENWKQLKCQVLRAILASPGH